MEITEEQYERIKDALPVQRGNVRLSNLQVLNAVLYVAEQGCKWRGSAEAFRPVAHDLHADESLVQERRSRSGIREVAVGADRADQDRGVRARLDLDQGASGRHGRSKKNGPQAIGKSRGGWNTKVHLVAANARTAITFALSPGHAHDAPEGRALLAELGPMPEGLPLLMDRAYEGDETRQLVLSLGMIPVVPPKVQPHRALGIRPRPLQEAQ